jgi:hypothetical protein
LVGHLHQMLVNVQDKVDQFANEKKQHKRKFE